MSQVRSLRAFAACAALGVVVLLAPRAEAAGPYLLDAHIDGPASAPGGFNYTPQSFAFNADAFEITFTHQTDNTSAALMGLQQSRSEMGSAVLHERISGISAQTAVVTLAMYGVRVADVHEGGSPNNTNGPEETVVLHVRKVVYTYQTVNPVTGQPVGAPVSITYQRGDTH